MIHAEKPDLKLNPLTESQLWLFSRRALHRNCYVVVVQLMCVACVCIFRGRVFREIVRLKWLNCQIHGIPQLVWIHLGRFAKDLLAHLKYFWEWSWQSVSNARYLRCLAFIYREVHPISCVLKRWSAFEPRYNNLGHNKIDIFATWNQKLCRAVSLIWRNLQTRQYFYIICSISSFIGYNINFTAQPYIARE
jgi:hypothetical protein